MKHFISLITLTLITLLFYTLLSSTPTPPHTPTTPTYHTPPLLTTQTPTLPKPQALTYHTSTPYTTLTTNSYTHAQHLITTYLNTHQPPSNLPLTITLDIDETILSNTPFQHYLHTTNTPYSSSTQLSFYNNTPLPLTTPYLTTFFSFLHQHNITIILITNRKPSLTTITKQQLSHHNLTYHHLYFRHSTTKDKDIYFNTLTSTHNIILSIGDKLNDLPNNTYNPNTTIILPNHYY